jgi:hypothetical protein
MLQNIKVALATYIDKYRKPGLPEPELSGLYALHPERGDLVSTVEMQWPADWQHARKTGVYFVFAKDGQLLYVGKAWHIGSRLAAYFDFDADKRCRQIGRKWSKEPAYVATIACPEGMSFEAGALEEYFIQVLTPRPTDNIQGYQGKNVAATV